jgi:hypothetical protein
MKIAEWPRQADTRNSRMAKTRHAAKIECSPTSSIGRFFFVFSNKNFSLRVEVLSCPRTVRYGGCGSGKGDFKLQQDG